MTDPSPSAAVDLTQTPYQRYQEYLEGLMSCARSEVEVALEILCEGTGQSVEEFLEDCSKEAAAGNRVPGICFGCWDAEDIWVLPDEFAELCEDCGDILIQSALFVAGINPRHHLKEHLTWMYS